MVSENDTPVYDKIASSLKGEGGWKCTDIDNLQFAKRIDDRTWQYRQYSEDGDDYREETVCLDDYTEQEIEGAMIGYYGRKQLEALRKNPCFNQIACECIFEEDMMY